MRNISCSNIYEVVDVVNHNTRSLVRIVQRTNGRIGKLEKRSRSHVWLGIIFGAVVELCFMEQNQKIAVLDERISALNEDIKELRYKEGD